MISGCEHSLSIWQIRAVHFLGRLIEVSQFEVILDDFALLLTIKFAEIAAGALESRDPAVIVPLAEKLRMQGLDHVERSGDQSLPDMHQFVDQRVASNLSLRLEIQQIHGGERTMSVCLLDQFNWYVHCSDLHLVEID